jgi:hypothetical protein
MPVLQNHHFKKNKKVFLLQKKCQVRVLKLGILQYNRRRSFSADCLDAVAVCVASLKIVVDVAVFLVDAAIASIDQAVPGRRTINVRLYACCCGVENTRNVRVWAIAVAESPKVVSALNRQDKACNHNYRENPRDCLKVLEGKPSQARAFLQQPCADFHFQALVQAGCALAQSQAPEDAVEGLERQLPIARRKDSKHSKDNQCNKANQDKPPEIMQRNNKNFFKSALFARRLVYSDSMRGARK